MARVCHPAVETTAGATATSADQLIVDNNGTYKPARFGTLL